jgi:hypothetical protein
MARLGVAYLDNVKMHLEAAGIVVKQNLDSVKIRL